MTINKVTCLRFSHFGKAHLLWLPASPSRTSVLWAMARGHDPFPCSLYTRQGYLPGIEFIASPPHKKCKDKNQKNTITREDNQERRHDFISRAGNSPVPGKALRRGELGGNFRGESLRRLRKDLSPSTSVSKEKARAEAQKARRTSASSWRVAGFHTVRMPILCDQIEWNHLSACLFT